MGLSGAGLALGQGQLAQLARLQHQTFTDARVGDLLAECEENASIVGAADSPAAVNVRELRRDYDRQTRLPAELVEEEAKLASLGQHTWQEARRESDFSIFSPLATIKCATVEYNIAASFPNGSILHGCVC